MMYEKKKVGKLTRISDIKKPPPLHSVEEIGFASKETLHNQTANLHWFNFKYNFTWMAPSQYCSFCSKK